MYKLINLEKNPVSIIVNRKKYILPVGGCKLIKEIDKVITKCKITRDKGSKTGLLRLRPNEKFILHQHVASKLKKSEKVYKSGKSSDINDPKSPKEPEKNKKIIKEKVQVESKNKKYLKSEQK